MHWELFQWNPRASSCITNWQFSAKSPRNSTVELSISDFNFFKYLHWHIDMHQCTVKMCSCSITVLTYSLTVSVWWWVRLDRSVVFHQENLITSSSSQSAIVWNKKSCNSVFDSVVWRSMYHTFLIIYIIHIERKQFLISNIK